MFGALPYLELGPWPIGPIAIHMFGVCVAVGVMLAEALAKRRAVSIGIDGAIMSRALGYLLIVGFIGGHVFNVLFYEPRLLLSDPLSLLRIWESQASYGGILGALIGLALFARKHPEQSIVRIADAAAFALPIGWLFGRIGCAFAHDHPGVPSSFFLAVDFGAHRPGGLRHDLGLEEALWWVFIVLLFFTVDRVRPKLRARRGFYPGLLAVSYAPIRFMLEFLRVQPAEGGDVRYYGLTPAQYISIAVFSFGLFLLFRPQR